MFLSKAGKSNQAGVTFLELLVMTAVLIPILAGLALFFYEVRKGERYRLEQKIQQLSTSIRKARTAATNGYSDPKLRTVSLTALNLPTGLELVGNVSVADLPFSAPVLPVDSAILFTTQSARTDSFGFVVVRDNHVHRSRAILITTMPGPIQEFVRFGDSGKFQPVTGSEF